MVNNKEKELKELDIKMLSFTSISEEIKTSFQDLDNMKKIVEFNKQNNYKYAITNGSDNIGVDLLSCEVICYLTNKDYVITSKYTDRKVVFKHKNLIKQEEEEREKIKEIRGY